MGRLDEEKQMETKRAGDPAAALAAYLNGDKTALEVSADVAAVLDAVAGFAPHQGWRTEDLRERPVYFGQHIAGREPWMALWRKGIKGVWMNQAAAIDAQAAAPGPDSLCRRTSASFARHVAAIEMGLPALLLFESIGLTFRMKPDAGSDAGGDYPPAVQPDRSGGNSLK
jgi:hypothetical protein